MGLMHSISKRLYDAQVFDAEIIEAVTRVATDQDISYREFKERYKVAPLERYKPTGLPAVQVLDLKPRIAYDVSTASVLHLPMANGLTRNKIFRAGILHLADPSQRLIVFANPGIPLRDSSGKPRLRHLPKVARGDLAPVVASSLAYLEAQHITSIVQYGYSFGADRALALAAEAAAHSIRVDKSVVADPASIKRRNLLRLVRDFNAGGKSLKKTLQAVDSRLLRDSRPRSSEHPLLVMGSLLRPANLAVARALSKGGFEGRLRAALQAQPDMKVQLVWGGESELSDDSIMQALADEYARIYPKRVAHTRIANHNHSMADDVALHAAIMLQASRNLDRL